MCFFKLKNKKIATFFLKESIFLLLGLIFAIQLKAQEDSLIWFRDFAKKNRVSLYAGNFSRSIQIETSQKENKEKSVRFSPNSFAFVGVNLQFKKLFVYLETAIPNTHKLNADQSDVKGYALFLSNFKKEWGFTAFVAYNNGLLMGIDNKPLYVNRNDIRRFSFGFHHYKIFNSKRFSYVSPNSGANQQVRSAGSPMLLTTPYFSLLQSNNSLLTADISSYHFNGCADPVRSLQLLSLQVKPGYIYNFVWGGGKYFFSPSAYAGIGAEYHVLKKNNDQLNDFNLNIGYRIKIVAGINNDRYYITAEWLRESSRSFLYGSQLKNTYQEMSLNVGVRF